MNLLTFFVFVSVSFRVFWLTQKNTQRCEPFCSFLAFGSNTRTFKRFEEEFTLCVVLSFPAIPQSSVNMGTRKKRRDFVLTHLSAGSGKTFYGMNKILSPTPYMPQHHGVGWPYAHSHIQKVIRNL